MVISLDTLKPQITPFVRGATDPVIAQMLYKAGREFAKRTEIWREVLPNITSVADDATYVLSIPNSYSADFHRILGVTYDETDLSESQWEFDPSTATLTLASPPSLSGKVISVSVVFMPRTNCASYPDWIINRYQEAIVQGALWMIKTLTGFPYSDEKGATQHYSAFMRACGSAKIDLATAFQSGSSFTRAREY